jgi:tetratricopeptide (TPR) repeat protein
MSTPPALPSEATQQSPIGIFAGTKRFRPVTLLGRGNKGVVYRVHDVETGTDVALKTLDTRDPDELYRLKQEFRVLAGITHPNLVELYELVVSENECFFTMELVEGINFIEHIHGGAARLPEDFHSPTLTDAGLGRFLAVSRQLVLGVSALHAAGKLHRDVKPSNMLVTKAGRLVLLDFGLAIALGIEGGLDNVSGVAAGTLAYMAPEQAWGGPPNPAADWYSVGVALYEALTGRLPFTGPPARMLRDKGDNPPPSPRRLVPTVLGPLDAIVTALLNADPARRPGAQAILEHLASCHATTGVPVAPQPDARGEAPFVGRAQEWAKLRFVCNSVARGSPAVIHVMGPSGIGKTELIRRFLSSVEQDGRTLVLRGRCHPRETMPYKGLDTVVDALSRVLISLPESKVAALVPRHAAALVRLFPVLGRVPALGGWGDGEQDAEPYEVRRRGVKALRELLARIADRQPLILWIDDLQWGDLDSATLLRELLRPPDAPAMALVLSYRSEDRNSIPLLSALKADNDVLPPEWTHEILLGALELNETRELARLLCAAQLESDQLISEIATESAGSPFFLGELARSVISGRSAGGAAAAVSLRLADVMHDRVQQLPTRERELLEIVSVAGSPLDRTVALNAAGLGEPGRPVILALEQGHFLRLTHLDDRPAVEVYHDRLREALVARLSPDHLATRHRWIAEALECAPDPDLQALFQHYLGAGDSALAGRYAVRAGDLAASTLAFDRAAQLYRQALRLSTGGYDAWVLHVRLGEALANCGRGGVAAGSFEEAASLLAQQSGDPAEILSLKRRAAEQYLRSGHIERGIALMRAVLAELGVSVPRTSRGAMLASVFHRARFLLRGVGFEPRGGDAISPQTLLRLDARWAVATSLSVVDPIVGDGVGVRCLIEALDVGERSRIVRTLGLEAAREAALGTKFFQGRSRRLLQVVERLARESGDPYDQAWLHQSLGTTAYFGARWRTTRDECDASVAIWRERCRGAAWEVVTGESFSISALAHMGDLRELSERLPEAIRDGDQRGDVYAATSLRMGVPNMYWLAQDRADEAKVVAAEAISPWPSTTFLTQHYLYLIATVQADLYAGDVWAAWRRVGEAWPKLSRAQFLSLAFARVELRHLRARAALAAAASPREGLPPGAMPPDPAWAPARLIRLARAEAAHLRREHLPSASPFASLIAAGIAAWEGDHSVAVSQLARAAQAAEQADMGLYGAAARHREGVLRGGEAGCRLSGDAERWMRAQGIQNPTAMVAVLTPGCAVAS